MLNDQTRVLRKFGFWAKLIAAVGAAFAVLGDALMVFNPLGKTDLTVQIVREIPVSLPSGVGSLPIRLVYSLVNSLSGLNGKTILPHCSFQEF